jgi:DeoR family transcriptional regulator, deoxyribose operon repressor
MSNKRTERAERILEILKKDGSAGIAELAATLDVTTMTVRRDLAELAQEELVRVYHGVVVPSRGKESFSHEYLLSQAELLHVEEKTRIARRAAALVEPNDILIIDAGSTAALTAGFIPKDMPVKIICFSLNVFLQSLDKGNSSVILVGGLYHDTSRVFESPESIELLQKYRATKAFISANGIREDLGVTCSNTFEIAIKQAAIQSSLQKILISDSSKFGKVTSCYFAALEAFDTVITDKGVPESAVRSMRKKNIKVEVV